MSGVVELGWGKRAGEVGNRGAYFEGDNVDGEVKVHVWVGVQLNKV